MDIMQSMRGCVEILKEFEIINGSKYMQLQKRVAESDVSAYQEISELLEEVVTSASELAKGA